MIERYGPWSSALADGLSPQLSTFWKRRLALLGSARAARLALTRRDWLKLSVGGAAACALPTLHLASAEGPEASKPRGEGKIYSRISFKTAEAGDASLSAVFAIDPKTGERTKLIEFDGTVRVSPDGRMLALSRHGWSGSNRRPIANPGLWVYDVEGQGAKRQVADFGGTMSWSPDGKQLIVTKETYLQDDERRHEAWRLNADGSGATKLPIPETDEVDDWSPDGQWLVTVSDRHPPRGSGYQLYLTRPDGHDQRRLTEGRGLNVYPRFSPDSRRIAYLHSERGTSSLWVVNIDGSGRRQVFEEANDVAPEQFCWSPDGKSLACTLETWQRDEKGEKYLRAGQSNPQIAIMDADGTNSRRLNLPGAAWIGALDWR